MTGLDWSRPSQPFLEVAKAANAAYAPTDQDEREALRDALVAGERKSRSTGGSASGLYSAQADAILAAGFRRTPAEHPAHSGHRYGGGYARAAALAAGDPDWQNATGGTTEHPEPPGHDWAKEAGIAWSSYRSEQRRANEQEAGRDAAEAKLARIADALRSNERSSVRVSMSLAILNDKEAD